MLAVNDVTRLNSTILLLLVNNNYSVPSALQRRQKDPEEIFHEKSLLFPAL
jgi:hypothetical protein